MSHWPSLDIPGRREGGGNSSAAGTGFRKPDSMARQYARILQFVRQRVDHSIDASDIVQEAFTRLILARKRGEVRNPSAFLRTTAMNVVRDRARAAAVRRSVQPECYPDLIGHDPPSVERIVEAREQLDVLAAAIAELTPKRRAALTMSRLEGLPQSAVADRLGLSLSMVEKHIHHAVRHCRRRVAEANGEV